MKTISIKVLMILLSSLLASCTIIKTSHVMVGEKRASIDVSQVKLYTTPPAKYIEIAILNVDAGHDFRSSQDLMDSAIERLKADAASMGANGVLLNNVGDKSSGGAVGIVTRPSTPSVPSMAVVRSQSFKNVSGTAIYIEK